MLETLPLSGADWRIGVTVNSGIQADESPTLMPTLGEYPIYDATLYEVMANDDERNWRFREALERFAKDKVVIDIGTGAALVWALEAARIGASQVYAIEAMKSSAQAASELLETMDCADRISLIHAESTSLSLEQRAEVCVAEIIGSLAGAEGAAAVLSDAKKRLLKPNAVIIPHQCLTFAAAANFAKVLAVTTPAFPTMALPYLKHIFTWAGGPFDVRLRVANPSANGILSDHGVVERLDFNGDLRLNQVQEVGLKMESAGSVDGILTWLSMSCLPDQAPLDALQCDCNWASIYFPLFDEAIAVKAGDTLRLRFETVLGEDGIHPDYRIHATLETAAGRHESNHSSAYKHTQLRTHPVYRGLFPAI
ncbi:MAG: 50S ribosomal protein L11 methyltransferase [Pseudomonadota bacterium]